MSLTLILSFKSFFQKIIDYIVDAFANISFSGVVVLITGILLGFLLFALFYLAMVLLSFRKKEPTIYKSLENVDDKEVEDIIVDKIGFYKEHFSTKPTGEKLLSLKDISYEMLNEIAKLYYPDSNHPIAELSIDEIILLNEYITKRVDELLSGKVLKPFRKYRISKVINLLDARKKVTESKAYKAAQKAKLPKIANIGWTILHVINPVFWVKKLIVSPTLSAIMNKIATIIIRIIGEEVAKVYSKSVFISHNDNEIQEVINELEKINEDE